MIDYPLFICYLTFLYVDRAKLVQRVKLTKTEVYQCLQHQRYKFYELLSRTAKPRKFTLKVGLNYRNGAKAN